ncbi:L-asparaginase [Rhodotorula sp. JG-1b]|nr:L-asparaginase [Rhodotorula sp. JG-1b]
MLFRGSLAALVTLAASSAVAAPLVNVAAAAADAPVRNLVVERDSTGEVQFNITYQSNHTAHLPKTLIMATGGTIAGSGSSNTDSTGYTAGVVGLAALVQAVPEVLAVSNIDGMQVINTGSESLSDSFALHISKLANKALCAADAPYDAVVITHGTDTLEETAYFIDATLQCDKTVVVVGAMRPSTAVSADGPNNLIQAVTTAVDPSSVGRGTLVVMNDRIVEAIYVEKTHANTVDTFKADEQGSVGMLLSDKAFYYHAAAKPTFKKVYDVSKVAALPRVDLFMGYQGADLDLFNASIAKGSKGMRADSPTTFPRTGTGSGSISDIGIANVNAIVDKVPVVRSTKINNGFVVPGAYYPTVISSGVLNPVKTRRLLQILLALGKNSSEIRTEFEEPLKSYINFNITSAY